MKTNYKKYNLGGVAQSFGSPIITAGMQAQVSTWGGSPVPVFAEGGKSETTMDAMLGKKVDALVGKRVMLFGEGQPMPTTQKITEVRVSPPSFRYRDLFFKVKGSDFEERIPQHDIVRFLLGEQVDVYNPAKGEYYAWQLSTRKKMGGGGKIGFEGLAKKVAKRYSGKKVESKYQDEYGKTYDSKEAMEVGRKVAAKVYRQQQGKMAKGGMLPNGKYSYAKGDEGMYNGNTVRVVSYSIGQEAYVFDILNDDDKVVNHGVAKQKDFEKQFAYFPKKKRGMMKNGGKAEVKIENKDVKFDKELYKGVLDDFDLDGLPNADDPNPLKSGDGASVEQTKLTTAVNNVIRVKDKMDVELDEFIGKLQKTAPNDSKIYGRTKTPYSILNKLVNSRLLDQKRGLKDLVGTTVAFSNFDDLVKFKKRVEKGMFGKVIEFDDYYENPNDGYRAYHFIVEQNGVPIELQLKTDRMKQINVLSHDAYKNKDLNVDYLLYLTTIANEADKGNTASKAEFERVMSDRVAVKKKLSSGKTQ